MQNLDPPLSLFQHFRRHLPVYLLGSLMLTVFQVAMNRIDWLSKQAVDLIFHPTTSPTGIFWRPILWILGLALLALGSRVASRWFIFFAGRDIEYELRQHLLRQLHRLGFAFYRKMPTGEIMSRATNDLTQIRMLMGFGIMNLINVGLALASALQVMLGISWRLTLVSLVALPLLLLITRLFASRMFLRTRKNQEALGSLSSFFQSHLAGVRVVRSFALEAAELRRFNQANQIYLKASLSIARLRGSIGPLAGSISAVILLLFFWFGGILLLKGPQQGGISEGGFFAFSLALTRMTWPIIALGLVVSILQQGRASYARLQQILTAEPETKDGVLSAPNNVLGNLRVQNLSFSYGDKIVLSNIAFTLPEGQSVAIVGRTGAGKTTLALLLARLLPTPKGTVFLDGVDICDLPLAFVHRTLGYAQQDAFLFSTTVSGNIGFGLEDRDSPAAAVRIRQVAEEAQLLEEVENLPEQFDTIVGERGVQLSGGQKQRISLARALIWQPKILLLDDPLSAVDAKTEAAILETLTRQAKRSSMILVTHRVAAASRCDYVLVLDQGMIVEQGRHEELLEKRGLYARFAEEQRMARELEDLSQGGML